MILNIFLLDAVIQVFSVLFQCVKPVLLWSNPFNLVSATIRQADCKSALLSELVEVHVLCCQ